MYKRTTQATIQVTDSILTLLTRPFSFTMKLLSLFALALSSSFTPVLCNLLDHSTRHNHQDSELVQFYKRAYQSDSGPGAISFRDAIAPDGVFYTNGMLLGE